MNNWKAIFDLPGKENRLKEIENILSKEDFWANPDQAKPILKERTALAAIVERFHALRTDVEECDLLLDLAVEESDNESLEEVSRQIPELEQKIKSLSVELMLDDPDDLNNAIVIIDINGVIMMANQAFSQMLGYTQEEVIESHIVEFTAHKEGSFVTTTGEKVIIDEEYITETASIPAELAEKGSISNWEK